MAALIVDRDKPGIDTFPIRAQTSQWTLCGIVRASLSHACQMAL
jgi:hypothetical protein